MHPITDEIADHQNGEGLNPEREPRGRAEAVRDLLGVEFAVNDQCEGDSNPRHANSRNGLGDEGREQPIGAVGQETSSE